MKTLVINGSPRKSGDSMSLVKEMLKHLRGDVRIIHAYYDDISPCIDCRYCWENDGCAINDEMQVVYKLLDEVDNVIIASPIYFSELTGELLSLFSRLQCLFVRRCIRKDDSFHLKQKNGVLILTGGGDGRFEPAIHSANIIFRQINVTPIGTVLSHNTNLTPSSEDDMALNMAKNLALQLNKLSNTNGVNKLEGL